MQAFYVEKKLFMHGQDMQRKPLSNSPKDLKRGIHHFLFLLFCGKAQIKSNPSDRTRLLFVWHAFCCLQFGRQSTRLPKQHAELAKALSSAHRLTASQYISLGSSWSSQCKSNALYSRIYFSQFPNLIFNLTFGVLMCDSKLALLKLRGLPLGKSASLPIRGVGEIVGRIGETSHIHGYED